MICGAEQCSVSDQALIAAPLRRAALGVPTVPRSPSKSRQPAVITNAPIADFLLVAARTHPEHTTEATSLFIVELPNPGFVIHKLRKEGIRASETGLIHIENAFVPDDCLLGSREGTYPVILDSLSERRNAFDLEVRSGIAEAVFEAHDSDDVRAVVICAGGDLKSLSEGTRPAFEDRERIRRLHPWFRELVNLEKPVIAAVDGPAFGAGFNLALACDFILGMPRARFCAVFGRIGPAPDLGCPLAGQATARVQGVDKA